MKVLFTFGNDKQFPYQNGYVTVEAKDREQALAYFRSRFPDKTEGVLNCAFVYYEGQDDETIAKVEKDGNFKAGCHEYIDLMVEEKREADKIQSIKARKAYLAFLKEEIETRCNKDGCCEIYWDYRDELSPSSILSAYNQALNDEIMCFRDFLNNEIYELNFDYDTDMFDEIVAEINSSDNELVIQGYDETNSIYDDAAECGYNGVDANLDGILRNTRLKVNIMFATDCERNYDMSSIIGAFGNYSRPAFDFNKQNLENGYNDFDNALTYLIHQQGHTVNEVFGCMLRGDETNDFLKSIDSELANNTSEGLSELTCLIELSGEDILSFFNTITSQTPENQFLSFSKDTMIGIFNEWSGGGSLLEVQLEKPFVVPVSMIRNVQVEGALKQTYQMQQLNEQKWEAQRDADESKVRSLNYKINKLANESNDGYTVDEVFGLVGSCWADTLSYTNEAPELVQEDMLKTLNNAIALEKSLEENEKDITDD